MTCWGMLSMKETFHNVIILWLKLQKSRHHRGVRAKLSKMIWMVLKFAMQFCTIFLASWSTKSILKSLCSALFVTRHWAEFIRLSFDIRLKSFGFVMVCRYLGTTHYVKTNFLNMSLFKNGSILSECKRLSFAE